MRGAAQRRVALRRYADGVATEASDTVAVEEPLEIRLSQGGGREPLSITMRTPGNDFELAAGYLFGEGVVDATGVRAISYCVDREVEEAQRFNIVNVALPHGRTVDADRLHRHTVTTSACGICGRTSLEAVEVRCDRVTSDLRVPATTLAELPERLRAAQDVFSRTGGLHAAGLFTATGALVAAREDVGRHNALDKLVGWGVLEKRVPFTDHVVVVSGRASFELVQKAVAAGAPVLCAVSAPSSLAIDLADRFGVTLVGFLRGTTCNVYTHPERIV